MFKISPANVTWEVIAFMLATAGINSMVGVTFALTPKFNYFDSALWIKFTCLFSSVLNSMVCIIIIEKYVLLIGCFPKAHTILLVQSGPNPETRTYSDYESVNECMEGVCKIYEEHLKKRNPNIPTITYDISQLFDFVEQVIMI